MNQNWMNPLKEINGINLENYYPQQRSYNSVEYVHKRYLNIPQTVERKKTKIFKKEKVNCDKSLQVSREEIAGVSKHNLKVMNRNDSVLEQTIKFAKDIVPLVLPPSEVNVPVFYTVKSGKVEKNKIKKPRKPSSEHQEPAKERNETKRVTETYRKVKKESFSVSHSSNNTIDDLNINQSTSCTLSEISEETSQKRRKSHNNKNNEHQKFVISESFKALATQNVSGDGTSDSKIKIHLMHDKDKNFLSDSIKIPVLNAIKDYIAELHNNNNNLNTEIYNVQEIVKCNTEKLDNILERLACIEKILDEKCSEQKKPHAKVRIDKSYTKTSSLQELEKDLVEIKDGFSSEEELHQEVLDRISRSSVIMFSEDQDKKNQNQGNGDGQAKVSSIGAKSERTARVPAKFCWTDAVKNN